MSLGLEIRCHVKTKSISGVLHRTHRAAHTAVSMYRTPHRQRCRGVRVSCDHRAQIVYFMPRAVSSCLQSARLPSAWCCCLVRVTRFTKNKCPTSWFGLSFARGKLSGLDDPSSGIARGTSTYHSFRLQPLFVSPVQSYTGFLFCFGSSAPHPDPPPNDSR